jgi:spore germination protein KB
VIKEGKIGVESGVALTVIIIIAKAFYLAPTLTIQEVGTAAWYTRLISLCFALVVFKIFTILVNRYQGMNIMEIYELAVGPYVGFAFCLILFLTLMFTAALNIREFADVLMVYTLPSSPPSFVIGLFILSSVVICFLGLESIARFSSMFFYVLIIGIVTVVILSIQNFNLGRIYPMLGYGIGKSMINSLIGVGFFKEIVILAVFAKSLQGVKHIKKIGYISLLVSGVIFTVLFFVILATFPYTVARELVAPMYIVASIIEYGGFFQRLESIFIFVWSLCALVSVTAMFYAGLMVYCHMFKIQDKRPIILPLAISFFAVSMIPQSFSQVAYKLTPIIAEYIAVAHIVPLFVTLGASFIRKRRREKRE